VRGALDAGLTAKYTVQRGRDNGQGERNRER